MKYRTPMMLARFLGKKQDGRLLGLDIGDKYVGVAVSDSQNQVASPLSVLVRKKSNVHLMAEDFQNLVSEHSLAGFVVGCPMNRLCKPPDESKFKVFVDDISNTGKLKGVNYTYWNECFTSKVIELLIEPMDFHPVEAKTIMDKFAAVTILQGYIDYMNRKLRLETQEENTSIDVSLGSNPTPYTFISFNR
ncbi:Putative pre-16S rRNA nuclease [Linum grandiflorum]